MPQTSNRQQGESTTYHGDAHGDTPFPADKWARTVVDAAVRCHTMAINAGSTPTWPADDWLKARRCADDALALLIEAVQLAGKGLGVYADMRGPLEPADLAPGTIVEIPAGDDQPWPSPRLQQADETLVSLGYRWAAFMQKWLAPAPAPTADDIPHAIAAASLLSLMGWVWTGGKWENLKPAPSVLDQPLGVALTIGAGCVSAVRFGPETPVRALVEHAEAMHNKLARVGAL